MFHFGPLVWQPDDATCGDCGGQGQIGISIDGEWDSEECESCLGTGDLDRAAEVRSCLAL